MLAARARVFDTGQGRKTRRYRRARQRDGGAAEYQAMLATVRPATPRARPAAGWPRRNWRTCTASSGQHLRHRLSRHGNRQPGHVLYIAGIVQLRHDTAGRAFYRRKLTTGKTSMEAMRCLRRRLSDAVCRQLAADALVQEEASPGGRPRGVSVYPARQACPGHRHFGSATSRTRTPDATPPERCGRHKCRAATIRASSIALRRPPRRSRLRP